MELKEDYRTEEQKQDAEFPTGQVYTIHQRKSMGLKCNHDDERLIFEILKIFREKNLSVDRASRVLADAQTMLPKLAKLPMN